MHKTLNFKEQIFATLSMDTEFAGDDAIKSKWMCRFWNGNSCRFTLARHWYY